MENKKFILICSLLSISFLCFIISKDYKESEKRNMVRKKIQSQKRMPSSNKPIVLKPASPAVVPSPSKEEIKIQKKIAKDFDLQEDEVVLTKVGPKMMPKLSQTINFIHYKIKIKSTKNDMQSTYDALIDPENGHIVKTWNKPHIEYPKKVTFNIKGREYNP